MLLLLFDLPYPAYVVTVSAQTLPYPVNCVMEILKRDVAPNVVPLSRGLFKSIFNEK